MKKVLLATTALVATTGFAMADISLSGSAEGGIASNLDTSTAADPNNDGEMHVYSGVTLDVTFSGESDNGIGFGASMNAETSSSDFDAGDWEFDAAEEALGFGNVYLMTGGLKVTLDDSGIDNLYDDDSAHDVQLDYTTGGLSFSATYDVDGDASDASSFSYMVGYDQDGISASITGDDNDDCTTLAAGYASGAFSVGVEADQGCGTAVNTLSASYSADAFSISGEIDDADGWEVSATFSQDGLSVTVLTDSSDYSELYGSMDLGGGLSVIGGLNSDDAYYLGATMSF